MYIEELDNLQNNNSTNNNNNGTFSKLKNKYNEINNYFDKTSAIRFLLVGPHNSGKSSILNDIIGYNQKFLPADLRETTKTGIIIKYVKKGETPKLFNTNFITNESGYNYFEYNKNEPIAEGETDIYSKIDNLNNEYSKNSILKFYLLESPIEFLDKMNITEEEKKKIELIDYPGLDTDFEKAIEMAKNLLKIVDGFIYVFFETYIDKGNTDVFALMYNTIKTRINFSFNTCLFILNKIDNFTEINYKEIQGKILKIFDDQNYEMDSRKVLEQKQRIGDENISLSGFSSKRYNEYKKIEENILNFENFIKNNITKKEESFFSSKSDDIKTIIKNLQENYLEKKINIKNFIPNQNEFNNRLDDLKNLFKNKNVDSEDLKKIVKLYLYILENRTNLKEYKLSKINDLLRNFNQVLENTFKFFEIKRQYEALDFIINSVEEILELFDITLIKVNNPKIAEFEGINPEQIIKNINDEKQRTEEYVDNEFNRKKDYIYSNIYNCSESENSFKKMVSNNDYYLDDLRNCMSSKCKKYDEFLKDKYHNYVNKLHLKEMVKSKEKFEENIKRFKETKLNNSSGSASNFISHDTYHYRFLFIKWSKTKYNHSRSIGYYKDKINNIFSDGKYDIMNRINQNTIKTIYNINNIKAKFNEEVGGFKDNLNEFKKIIEEILNFIYINLGIKG